MLRLRGLFVQAMRGTGDRIPEDHGADPDTNLATWSPVESPHFFGGNAPVKVPGFFLKEKHV